MAQISVPTVTSYRRQTRTYDLRGKNTAEVFAVISQLLLPTGSLIPTLATAAPNDGFAICDGSALSKTDFSDLYAVLGSTYGETSTTFNLPDLRGRMPLGAGGVVSLGAFIGSSEVTLTTDELPAHTHGVTDAGHAHTVTDPGHGHAVTDPGHTHTVTDPGHTHGSDQAGGAADAGSGGDEATAETGTTDSATTGVTIDSATTGVTVGSNTTGVTVDSQTTGVTVDSAGSGQAFDITPPSIGVNWMIRT